jgi:hypothetical protein
MHDELWAGIDPRLRNARKTLDDMRKVFQPAQPTHWRVVQESAVAIVGGPDWQQSFYQMIARLLAEVRAVPWIIEASFGEDRKNAVMSAWWANELLPDEQQRRKTFSAQFKTHRAAIDTHPLTSEARDVAEHRRGFPEIEGRVIGPFGNVHIATPTECILDAESRPLEPTSPTIRELNGRQLCQRSRSGRSLSSLPSHAPRSRCSRNVRLISRSPSKLRPRLGRSPAACMAPII